MAADDIQQLCDVEFIKLTQKLQSELERDIARIYSHSIFCDLKLVLGSVSLYLNCCVLQGRANSFYSHLCSLQKTYSKGYELNLFAVQEIQNFVRKVYEPEEISAVESLVVKLLQDIAVSPDCDQYATPLTSPTDISCQQSGVTFKTEPSYYSIVSLDWEKELAEQDFLIESFRSILKKEQCTIKSGPKKSASLNSQDYKRGFNRRLLSDLKRAVEEDRLLLQEDNFSCLVDCPKTYFNPRSWSEAKLLKVKCCVVHLNREPIDLCDECGFFDAEDSLSTFNKIVNEKQQGTSEKKNMSSNIEIGPDSGLATSAEETPLDQESGLEVSKSISSSVSSDCCLWDSSSGPPQHSGVSSWVDCAPHQDNYGIGPDFVDCVLEELVGKSQQQNRLPVCEDVSESTTNMPKHNYFIDASSLLDETEIQPSSLRTASESESRCNFYQEISQPCLGHVSFEAMTQPTKMFESVEQCQTLSVAPEICDYESEESKISLPRETITPTSQLHSTRDDVGNEKPPSLIRSNTFELETEDDRLTLLRQEYERRQGSLIFQRCASHSSGPLSDAGSDLNLHCTSLILPEIDPTEDVTNPLLFTMLVVEDEIQTPDSLNSDLPESAQEKLDSNKAEQLQSLCLQADGDYEIEEKDTTDNLPSDMTSSALDDLTSPLFARSKTECAPILSGAAPPLSPDEKLNKKTSKIPHVASLSSAWVVDISDITNSPEPRKRKGDLSSFENQSLEAQGDEAHTDSKSLASSLGYFIDLKDPRPSLDDAHDNASNEGGKISRQSSDSGNIEKQNACEFFVDLNHPIHTVRDSPKYSENANGSEKKLFSMFIDIGDKVQPKAKPELTSRTRAPLSPFSAKKKNLMQNSVVQADGSNKKVDSFDTGDKRNDSESSKEVSPRSRLLSTCQNSDPQRSSFFMFIESESTSGKEKAPPSKLLSGNNPQNGKERLNPKIQHVRAQSASSMKRCMTSSLYAALPGSLKHQSSQSLQTSGIFSDSDEISTKPIFSSFHASLPLEESQEERVNRNQVEVLESSELSCHMNPGSNESSACSLETYSVHTPEQSSVTEDNLSDKKDSPQNYDFPKQDEVHKDPAGNEDNVEYKSFSGYRSSLGGVSLKTVNSAKTGSKIAKSFVRLSDLDREPVNSAEQSLPPISHRMTRSIPETSWIERKSLMSHSTGGTSAGSAVMSRSSRSLSRLFPHMSLHTGTTGRSKTWSTCSPYTDDLDTMRSSQTSDMSSLQSSAGLEYSTESTDLSSGRGSPTTLGDDLLKMFLEEMSTDVIVEVGGRRIKAHKCILSSRCQYFAAILSGGWVESAGNVISIQGFSYTVVHFALCHIYSGASTIPDQISIVELASLADILFLEGLKDVIMYTLKVKYCHFFHKPCAVCSVGVLECLPLAAAYGLDDIYHKSLRWITKFFVRIWPTKTFTALPRELIEKCYQQHVIHMTSDNVLETILCCNKLLSTIPTVRWAESVFVLTSRLMEACIKFMSDNFCNVLSSDNFLSLGREVPWNVSRLQESLVSACERMPPDQSCRSFSQLCSVLSVIQGTDPPAEMTWHPNFVELLVELCDLSERTLIKQAARAARTVGWSQMPTELRRKIQDAACLVLAPADHASSRYKRSVNDELRHKSQRNSHSRNLDLHQVKLAMVQHARRNESSDHHQVVSSVVVRKNIPIDRSNTISRRSAPAASNKPQEKSVLLPSQGRPKTWPAQVKSRYLEKRPNHSKQTVGSQERNKQLDAPVPQRRAPAPVKGMFISSSDSSRNSSPAMKRSSTVSSSKVKGTDSTTRARAATVTVCNPSHTDISGSLKEHGISKSTDNISRRTLSSNVKVSATEPLKTSSKQILKDSLSPEGSSYNPKIKQDSAVSQTSSTLCTQSQSITMSNDSLATMSSTDDVPSTHAERASKTKSPTLQKSSSARITSGTHNVIKRTELTSARTPLCLANKKASPSTAQKKTPLLASKALECSVSSSPSPLSKRSVSHVVKSPNLSTTGSRLAIPLRTSRSVSSVPDKGHTKASCVQDCYSSRKPSGKEQCRSNYISSSKRTNPGITNSALVGRPLSSNGSKNYSSEGKSANYRNTDNVNGEGISEETVHPTVGPRSGTFLKDEPTVLKTSVAENN